MNILILKGFNNYFNRISIKYNTLSEYQSRSSSYFNFSNVNFNSADGVDTELIIGNENQQATSGNTSIPLNWENDGAPDYLVCYETGTGGASIKHRWFVIECDRTRTGQYKLSLRRDVLADHYNEVTNATCFIEKGAIEDINDPAIYNKEDITTNQIKSDEFLLKDETQCGWVVGYVAKEGTAVDKDGAVVINSATFTAQEISGPDASDSSCDEIYDDFDEFYEHHPDLASDIATLNMWEASISLDVFYARLFGRYKVGQTVTLNNYGIVSYVESEYKNDSYLHSVKNPYGFKIAWKLWTGDYRPTLAKNLIEPWRNDTFSANLVQQIANKESVSFANESQLQSFFNYIKKNPIIKIGTKYYRPFDKYGGDGGESTITTSHYATIGSTAFDLLNNFNRTPLSVDLSTADNKDKIEGNAGNETYKITYSINRHGLGLREIFSKCKAKIPATVPVLKDAPYHMFAIPFSDDLALYSGNTLHCTTNKSVAMTAAQALATHAGAGVVYDIQLLPYCPVRNIIKTDKVSGHAEIATASYDQIAIKFGLAGSTIWKKTNIVKLNHQYVLAKNITLASGDRCIGIKSDSPIYIKIGNGSIEQPTQTITSHKVEIRYTDIQDTTSDLIIAIYENASDNTPSITIDYATYSAGTDLIGVYCTDVCEYANTIPLFGTDTVYYITYVPIVDGSRPMAVGAWSRMFEDYIYYEDYYLSKIDISNVITSDIVTLVDNVETDIVSTIFWCTESQFSFNKFIDNYFLLQADGSYKQDVVTDLINAKVKRGNTVDDVKVSNQVEMLRLASPNYSNFFDVNVQRNNGIEYINIDCTYKPYSPYLHLNPNFKALYGADYNDVRGLICGGDYSIALTTDAWATYQLQNKNYQAIFDRQIQQLEVQQEVQRDKNVLAATLGVVGGAIGGAKSGAKVGGGYGAAIGAVVGAGASALGGAANLYYQDRLRDTQMASMKDIYGYQLDNIKALPQGLAKTSYLTNNNKLFPFLEFYTCTLTEDMAVRDLIDYNGMTINRIGKIEDFQSSKQLPYIKAKLIRITTIEDSHQVKAIADELQMGVYLPIPGTDIEIEGD